MKPLPIRLLSGLLLLLMVTSLTSCVTLFCSNTTRVRISATPGTKLIKDTANFTDLRSIGLFDVPATTDGKSYIIPHSGLFVSIPRSASKVVPITCEKDSVRKTTYLHPVFSKWCFYNVFNYGLGFLLDGSNPNRYSYKSRVYVNMNDPLDLKYNRFAPMKKNETTLNCSIPYATNFYFNDNKSISGFGFYGVSVGGNYYYKNNQFLSLQAGVAINLPIPVPAAYDRYGDTINIVNLSSIFINLKNNYSYHRFDLGYGLSFSKNSWNENKYIHDSSHDYKTYVLHNYRNLTAGASFSAYYRLGKSLHIGLLYQPWFLSIQNSPTFKYEHSITLDVMWRYRLNHNW